MWQLNDNLIFNVTSYRFQSKIEISDTPIALDRNARIAILRVSIHGGISHSVDSSILRPGSIARTLNTAAWFDNFGNNAEIAEDVDAVREQRSRTLESESPMVSYLRVAEYYREPCGGTYHRRQQWRSATVLVQRDRDRIEIFSTIFETWAELSLVSDITKMPGNELVEKNSANFHNNIRGRYVWGERGEGWTVDFAQMQ